jgi:DTW domain-containing protein YfiP
MPSRSVVLAGAPRCERCRLPPRWCICAAADPIRCPLAIDVLFHVREWFKPTSTGRLITRVVAGARGHVFQPDAPFDPESIRRPGHQLWILHPLGEPLAGIEREDSPQVLLLDSSWREATSMMRVVARCGRMVSLPMNGPSRYRLRAHQGAGGYSTAEALLFLLRALGHTEAHEALRHQFELHVYAGLRARGEKAAAEAYLADSPAKDAFPDLIAELNRSRPRE